MRYRCLLVAALGLVSLAATRPALAVKPFLDAFKPEYIEKNEHKEFVEEVNKNGCLLCHQGAKSKKNRNAFGAEVAKLLTKKDAKDAPKIKDSLKKALEMHVDPKDDKSETYLDRVKAGKWPVGTLAELKEEPAKDAAK